MAMHNIFAQFSTSLDEHGKFKDYPVVNGSAFNEEYSETLDSATLVLSQIPKEKRLFYAKPYDFVRVYDASTEYDELTDTYEFDKIYLIDNIHEKENNIKEHIFGYTINLMSETKLLEKFQCPNLVITHKVYEDGTIFKKTIFKHIKDYMNLYVPKMKFSSGDGTWSYQPVVKLGGCLEDTYSTNITWVESDFVRYNERNTSITASVSMLTPGTFTIDVPIDGKFNINFISDINCVSTPGVSGASAVLVKSKRVFEVTYSIPSSQTGPGNIIIAFHTFDYFELLNGGAWIEPLPFDLMHLDDIGYEIISGIASITKCEVVKSPFSDANDYAIHVVVRKYDYFEEGEEITLEINANYYEITDEKWKKFDVPCADLSFNAPTLRQLLTLLMQQVGCIPVVHNRTLDYLDFQVDSVPFGGDDKGFYVNDTVNYISKGISSDSFVNKIVNMSSNVLDSGNSVYTESIGFRDKNSVLIKQENNLELETRLPIFKVEKFNINSYVKAKVLIMGIRRAETVAVPGEATGNHMKWNIIFTRVNNLLERLDFDISLDTQSSSDWRAEAVIDGDFVAFNYNNVANKQVTHIHSEFNSDNYTVSDYMFDINLRHEVFDMFYFHGTISIQSSRYPEQKQTYEVLDCTFNSSTLSGNNLLTIYSQDITPLLVENSVRQYLSTDFNQMAADTSSSSATIEDLAKYVYGTVGYSIGSNRISGFSTVYNDGMASFGWLEMNYTYIENIWNFIISHYTGSILETVQRMYGDYPLIIDNDNPYNVRTSISVLSAVPYNPVKNSSSIYRIFNSNINFSYLWFDIAYQPLNSFNLAYVKTQESVDYAIEQYNGNSSGLTDFDRLAIHEQEIVDRVGNDTLSISQRTDKYDDIQSFKNGPLYFLDNEARGGASNIKYIVFKRSFTVNNNCFNANYVASKDAILKNYFTSIRTKYRAYQYVDYSQSVLRKERDLIYVRISENDWYDGDDKVYFGEFNALNDAIQRRLSDALLPLSNSIIKISKNAILNDGFEKTRNDLSVVSYKNFFALIYEEADNVGSGTYMASTAFQQALAYQNALLGGVPQTWQIWNEGYNDYHYVSYAGVLNIQDIFNDYVNLDNIVDDEIVSSFDYILALPLVDDMFLENNITLSIVDDKNTTNLVKKNKRMFYKDYAERINHTVQFIYYSVSENILWTEYFIKGEIEDLNNVMIYDLTGIDFEINDNEYNEGTDIDFDSSRIVTLTEQFLSFHNGNNRVNPYIEIDWSNIPSYISKFKIIQQVGEFYRDIVAFKRSDSNTQRFYITLNDTKTDYVMAEKNGILYRGYKVATNTKERNVEEIYTDNEEEEE